MMKSLACNKITLKNPNLIFRFVKQLELTCFFKNETTSNGKEKEENQNILFRETKKQQTETDEFHFDLKEKLRLVSDFFEGLLLPVNQFGLQRFRSEKNGENQTYFNSKNSQALKNHEIIQKKSK